LAVLGVSGVGMTPFSRVVLPPPWTTFCRAPYSVSRLFYSSEAIIFDFDIITALAISFGVLIVVFFIADQVCDEPEDWND